MKKNKKHNSLNYVNKKLFENFKIFWGFQFYIANN